jgi:hypothetical protein
MTTNEWINPRRDQLFRLLPTVYQTLDGASTHNEHGPLREFMGIITEQVNLLEDDLARWYDNLFIETCEDWVVPYIGDLVGYEPTSPILLDASSDDLSSPRSVLYPRREVADTIALRRRKGSLAVLEELSRRFVGWPARAVEYRRAVAGTASLQHLRPRRSSFLDLRDGDALDRLDSAFDLLPRSVDMRSIDSSRTVGRHHPKNVGLFVCRRKIDSVTLSPLSINNNGLAHLNIQEYETPLHVLPTPERSDQTIAQEINLPVPLTRKLLRKPSRSNPSEVTIGANPDYYGIGKSLFILAQYDVDIRLIHPDDVVVAPLTTESSFYLTDTQCNNNYRKVIVDPESGLAAFHQDCRPDNAWATFHVGKTAWMGGGEYQRKLSTGIVSQQIAKDQPPDTKTTPQKCTGLVEAVTLWLTKPDNYSVIEITDNGEYAADVSVCVPMKKTLEIRAANFFRPTLQLDRPDKQRFNLTGQPNSHLILDGILFNRGTILIDGEFSTVTIRHCTFVPDRAKLQIRLNRTEVRIEKSHLGPIEIRPRQSNADCHGDESQEPIDLKVIDSTIDGRKETNERDDVGSGFAIAGRQIQQSPSSPGISFEAAHAVLTLQRSTVMGEIAAVEVGTILDSILIDQVCIENTQRGCIRYSYVAPNSCTPARYQCQPISPDETSSITPVFMTQRYGHPDYLRLSDACSQSILKGASDQGEMGVYHNEFFTLRTEHLRQRIKEFIPAASSAGIIFET